MLFEDSTEIQRIIVSDDIGDLVDVIVCSFKQADRVVNARGNDILHRRQSSQLFEIAQEPADRHTPGASIFFDVDFFLCILNNLNSPLYQC